MKKPFWIGFIVAIVSFISLSNDPLNDAVNFIIAGSIPGTNISFGFWSTMLLAFILFLIIRRAASNTRHKVMMHHVEKVKAKNTQSKFEELHTSDSPFDQSQRSVIAARKSESTL